MYQTRANDPKLNEFGNITPSKAKLFGTNYKKKEFGGPKTKLVEFWIMTYWHDFAVF